MLFVHFWISIKFQLRSWRGFYPPEKIVICDIFKILLRELEKYHFKNWVTSFKCEVNLAWSNELTKSFWMLLVLKETNDYFP